MYDIKNRTYRIAKDLDVFIFPSEDEKHKIDIYDLNGCFMFSVGDIRYMDYPSYIEQFGTEYANKRRALYVKRHAAEVDKIGSKGWFAFKLLWS
jgi:hypothetical protein